MNLDHIGSWLDRKLALQPLALNEPRSVTERHTRIYGPLGEFAAVSLSATPSEAFSFVSHANWPRENYDTAILDGILDIFLCVGVSGVGSGAAFFVDSIEWHDVDSNAVAYYHASKAATKAIIADNLRTMS